MPAPTLPTPDEAFERVVADFLRRPRCSRPSRTYLRAASQAGVTRRPGLL
jgi:hypothetical protein